MNFRMKGIRVLVLLTIGFHTLSADEDKRQPPSFTENAPKLIQYSVSEKMIELKCEAEGIPRPTFEWTKDGERVDPNNPFYEFSPDPHVGTISMSSNSLVEGYYQCTAKNTHGEALSIVTYVQRGRIDHDPDKTVEDVSVPEGNSLTLACGYTLSVPAPSVTWATSPSVDSDEHEQKFVNMDQRINIDEKGNLYFSNVNQADGLKGIYRCRVYNKVVDHTQGGSYARINVLPNNNKVNRKPFSMYKTSNPDEHSAPVEVVKGETLELKCLFDALPTLSSISWTKTPGSLPMDRHEMADYGTKLIVRNVREDDAGMYECRGTNVMGSATSEINVVVKVAPVFSEPDAIPQDMTVTEGDDVTMDCASDGDPDGTVQWYLNAKKVQDVTMNPRYVLGADGTTFTIRDVCKDCDDGTSDLKNFHCNASNPYGYDFAGGYINVVLRTTLTQKPPERHELQKNETQTFPCVATSDDLYPHSISWLRDDNPLVETSHRYVDDSDRLVLVPQDDEEKDEDLYGKYTCVASSFYSQEKSDMWVQKPGEKIPVVAADMTTIWIIIGVLAGILLIFLLCLCCCCYLHRNRGDSYPVDKVERTQGNDPVSDCEKMLGYHEYQRMETAAGKGSRASLSSTTRLYNGDHGGSQTGLDNVYTRRSIEDLSTY